MAPEAKPNPRRTVNGQARFLGGRQMRKYNSTITCKDQNAPAFDGLWAGDVIVINCAQPLSYPVGGSPGRTIVPGTTPWMTGGHMQYYPQIEFMVVDFEDQFEEYEADHVWRLTVTET